MSKMIIVEGNSNDKDNVRVLMVKGEKGEQGDLNHNDIIDNLTSNSTNKVLSAKQGKVLKNLIDENEENAENTYATKTGLNEETLSRTNADNNLQSQISSLASGSPKAVNSISQMTDTTKNYVLTTDGHWYYYNGTTWADGGVYQSTGIADESITPEKTTFINKYTNNYFDKTDIIEGGFYNSNGYWVTSESYISSNKIYISDETELVTNSTGIKSYFDSNDTFISAQTSTTLTIPANTSYFYVALSPSDLNSLYILKPNESLYLYYQLSDNIYLKGEYIAEESVGYNKTNFFKEKWSTYSNRVLITDMIENTNLSSTGETIEGNYVTSKFIRTFENENLAINNYGARICFYDANKQFISGIFNPSETERTEFTTPLNTYYLKFVTLPARLPAILCLSSIAFNEATEHKLFIEMDETIFNTIKNINNIDISLNCLGDSITLGLNNNNISYADFLAETFKTVRKYGVSGSAIAKIENKNNSFLERYENMDDDADVVLIMGGTNDFGLDVPLGTFSSADEYTFYGALKSLITGMIAKYPTKKIFFVTELDRGNITNNINLSFVDYINAIKEVCRFYAIPILDLNADMGYNGKNTLQRNYYIPDGLHPNTEGHKVISEKIKKYINYQL